jgi:hypothetical protein
MNSPTLPTADDVRNRLDCDPETGIFTWRACAAMRIEWNTRYAGAVAGSDNSQGYRDISIDGKRHLAHRLAWLIMTGEWPVDDIDHINGDRADNRIANLRAVDRTENMRNAAMRSDNTSGHMGVCWDKRCEKWRAQIKANGRRIHLGLFTALADAIAARAAAEIAYGFHQNHGRAAS